MLTTLETTILDLIRASFGNVNSFDIPAEYQKNVTDIILKNDILQMVYPALPKNMKNECQTQYLCALYRTTAQRYEGQLVLNVLAERGFDCIALKGWELCNLYPKKNMRSMVDLDILVRPYQYDKINEIMVGLGYEGEGEKSWKHDNFRKGQILIEMHKRLTDDSRAIKTWEQSMWERSILVNGAHIFKMTPEDFYLFHFLHLYKDFKNGKLGLRRLVDTWLLCFQQQIDMTSVQQYLKEFEMELFHERIVHLSKAVMCETEWKNEDEILLRHAMKYGIFGTEASYKAGRITAMSSGNLHSSDRQGWHCAACSIPCRCRQSPKSTFLHEYSLPPRRARRCSPHQLYGCPLSARVS